MHLFEITNRSGKVVLVPILLIPFHYIYNIKIKSQESGSNQKALFNVKQNMIHEPKYQRLAMTRNKFTTFIIQIRWSHERGETTQIQSSNGSLF